MIRFRGCSFRSHRSPHELNLRRALAAEVREIQTKDPEKSRPAGLEVLELIIPIVGAGEETVNHTDHADSA
jgi:hypothetical protein